MGVAAKVSSAANEYCLTVHWLFQGILKWFEVGSTHCCFLLDVTPWSHLGKSRYYHWESNVLEVTVGHAKGNSLKSTCSQLSQNGAVKERAMRTLGKYCCQKLEIWPHLGVCLWLSVPECILVGAWLELLNMPGCVYRSYVLVKVGVCICAHASMCSCCFSWSCLHGRKCDYIARGIFAFDIDVSRCLS